MAMRNAVQGSLVDIQSGLSGRSPHTKRAYIRHIRNFLNDVTELPVDLSSVKLDVLTDALEKQNVAAWLGMLKEKGRGKQLLGQARAALVWLGDYLDRLYPEQGFDALTLRIRNVTLPKAEEGQRPGTWLTRAQIKLLIAAVKQVRRQNPTLAARDRIMLLLLLLCGLRRAEIVALHWKDFVYQGEHPVLLVQGKGNRRRMVKLPSEILEALENWKTLQQVVTPAEFIFTQVRKNGTVISDQITTETIRERLQKLAELAELPHIAPHDMRRTFARSAFEAGASMEMIKQTLGHASVTTTEKYVNATLQLDHAATDVFAEALRRHGRSTVAADTETDISSFPVLLTRAQAADFLGISMAQFDVLKKSAQLDPARAENPGKPSTNAKTRPFRLYRRDDVANLRSEAIRRFGCNKSRSKL